MTCIIGCSSNPTQSITSYVTNNNGIREAANTIIKSEANTDISTFSFSAVHLNLDPASCCEFNGKTICNPEDLPQPCDSITINQTSSGGVKIATQVKQSVVTEQQKKIVQELQNQIQKDIENTDPSMIDKIGDALGIEKTIEAITSKLNDSVSADITTNFTQETISDIIIKVSEVNDVQIVACATLGTDCEIDQSNIIDIQVANYVNAIANTIASNDVVSKVNSTINSTVEEENDLSNIMDRILSGNMNNDDIAILVLVLCILIVLIIISIVASLIVTK